MKHLVATVLGFAILAVVGAIVYAIGDNGWWGYVFLACGVLVVATIAWLIGVCVMEAIRWM